MSDSCAAEPGGQARSEDDAGQLDQLAERFLRRLREGERPSVESYAVQHPAFAEQIRQLFPLLEMLESEPPPGAAASAATLPETATRFQPGAVLVERYEIIELVGRGGMGEVYRARDRALDREVAIKTLLAHRMIEPEALLRFEREAKSLAALSHPNVLIVYDIGRHETGQSTGIPFVVTEFLRGRNLADCLVSTPFDAERVAAIGEQIAAGLAAAHAQGIVHRDIKPHNVWMQEDGRLKVLDFGLARLQRGAPDEDVLTVTGTGMLPGTAAYMSPEQALGHAVTTATDVFSLGTLLYELTTRLHPFRSESVYRTMQLIVEHQPPAPSQHSALVPGWLDELILHMLDKDPQRRPNAAEVRRLLAERRTSPAARGAGHILARVATGEATLAAGLSPAVSGARDGDRAGVRLGEFDLLSIIGSGGMAVVYRARQAELGREVALKCMRAGNEKWERRFRREMQALASVKHPHLVEIYSSGAAEGHSYYAMEFIDGADLTAVCQHLTHSDSEQFDEQTWRSALTVASDAVRARERAIHDAPTVVSLRRDDTDGSQLASSDVKLYESPAYVQQIVRTMIQIAEALGALHRAGIVHRDVKPSNIMLARDGSRAVLIDPGIARLINDADHRLTQTHEVVGTLLYASPEQVLSVGTLDHRSDIYSVGATLWELLTFRPLFGAGRNLNRKELMHCIEMEEPAPLRPLNRAVTSDLEAIVHKCLEKNPDRRYATSDALAADLQRYLDGKPVQARPVGLVTRSWRTIGRRLLLMYCSSGIGLAALLGAAYWLPRGRSTMISPTPGDPWLMRIGIKPWVGYCPLIVAREMQWCSPVRIELVPVGGLEDSRRLLDRRDIDVAMWMVDTHVLARSSGIDTKVVLKLDTSLEADAIVAREAIQQFTDLRGKRVTYQHQEASHFLLLALCERYNVNPNDLELLADSARGAADRFIADPDIAAAVTYDPHLFNALQAVPGAHRLASGADVPGAIADIMTVREDYLESHRDEVKTVLNGWFRAVDVLNDPSAKDHGRAVDLACRFFDKYAPRENGSRYGPQDYYAMAAGMRYGTLHENLEYFRVDAQGGSAFREHFSHAQHRWASHHQMGPPTRAAEGDGSEILF